MLQVADKRVFLPIYGFADSFNLSVAMSLLIQRLFYMYPEVTIISLAYAGLTLEDLLGPRQLKLRREASTSNTVVHKTRFAPLCVAWYTH